MLFSFGLDYRRARLEVREQFSLDDGDVPRVCEALAHSGVEETVLNRTCNRVEVYGWWPALEVEREAARAIVRAWLGGDGPGSEALLARGRLRVGGDAARHLLRVAGGLESQILGDIHILGQVRRAFSQAIDAQTTGSHLHRLFELALRVGKQVQRGTSLMAARNGVGSEAARTAAARWGDLGARRCVVVGCGKSGTHSARSLVARGATDVILVNRTLRRAEALASELGAARAEGLDALPRVLASADVVVVATGAHEPVITRSLLEGARGQRAATPGAPDLLVIDVSVPRNVEAAAGGLPGVALLDLDALHPEAAEVEKARRAAVPEAEAIVESGVDEYLGWLELKEARNALRPMRDVISEVCRRELIHLAGASVSAERTVDRIVASVMAHPMTALRSAADRGERIEDVAHAVRDLFQNTRRSHWAPSS